MAMTESKQFSIFRAKDAPMAATTGCMQFEPFKDAVLPLLGQVQEAGVFNGAEERLLFAIPGFSLLHAWFKHGYPLPLHSHDADCLYYIVAGSIRLGTETLGPRDGFFVPANVPYTYMPGPEGVEVLEFRHATSFNFVNHANGLPFWQKALETVTAKQDEWATAKMPALNT
jgi:hypothetical protein